MRTRSAAIVLIFQFGWASAQGQEASIEVARPVAVADGAAALPSASDASSVPPPTETSLAEVGQQGAKCGCGYAGCRHVHPGFFGWLRRAYGQTLGCYEVRPFGSFTHNMLQMQALHGLEGGLVLYEYDFTNDVRADLTRLNPRGISRLHELVPVMERTGKPLTIQRSTLGTAVDESRRQWVIGELAAAGVDGADDSVVIARVPITGIGAAGERDLPQTVNWDAILQNRLRQAQNQGTDQLLPGGGSIFSSR